MTDAERIEYIDVKLESMMEHMMVVQSQLKRYGLLPNYGENGQPNVDAMQVGTAEYHWQAIKKKHNDAVTELQKLLPKQTSLWWLRDGMGWGDDE